MRKRISPILLQKTDAMAPDNSDFPTSTQTNSRRPKTSRASFQGSTPRLPPVGSLPPIPAQSEEGRGEVQRRMGLRLLPVFRFEEKKRTGAGPSPTSTSTPIAVSLLDKGRDIGEVESFFGYGCSFSTLSDLISLPT